MNITSKQWFQIISSINGGLITGAALLQTLFGQDLTLKIVAVLGIGNIIVGSVGAAVSGQGSLVRDVAAMPGVSRVTVDPSANQTLAQAAIDPGQPKIGTLPQDREAVSAVAKGA